jgi:hypothetical protein
VSWVQGKGWLNHHSLTPRSYCTDGYGGRVTGHVAAPPSMSSVSISIGQPAAMAQTFTVPAAPLQYHFIMTRIAFSWTDTFP